MAATRLALSMDGQLPPLTKRALGLAKGCVSDDWDYRDVLADALVEKYGPHNPSHL